MRNAKLQLGHPFLAIAFFAPFAASAALTVVEEQSDQKGVRTVYQLTVTPAAEPVPALRHRLVLRETEYKPGNAAVHYLRSFPEGGDVHKKFEKIQEDFKGDDIYGSDGGTGWYSIDRPLEKLDRDKLRSAAGYFDTTINAFVRPGSERRDCDWSHGQIFEMTGPDIYAFLLPEIQTMRDLSRALMLKTRSAVADGKYDEAIDLLRMNYRLGENVGRSPFLVSRLVGIAIGGLGHAEAIELIAAKDSPNLYWALSELPQPLVSVRDSIRIEMSLVTRVFPVLADAEQAEHSPEEWTRLIAKGFGEAQWAIGAGPRMDEFTSQCAIAGIAIVGYPDAKRRLIAGALDAATVERMPVGQVLAVDAGREFRRIADGLEKWLYVPYRDAADGYDRSENVLLRGDEFSRGFGGMIADLLLPALNAARTAEARLSWQLGGLRTVEAVRMHAAVTGKLPASLDDVTVAPLPINLATDKPYAYRLDGDKAVIDLPFEDGFPGVAYRFEVRLAE